MITERIVNPAGRKALDSLPEIPSDRRIFPARWRMLSACGGQLAQLEDTAPAG